MGVSEASEIILVVGKRQLVISIQNSTMVKMRHASTEKFQKKGTVVKKLIHALCNPNMDLLPALLSINHNQPSLEIIIVNSFEDLHL